VTAVTLPFFINTTCVELILISVFVFEARNPGNARAGAAANSNVQAASKAENENPRAFIAREAIRFFRYSSVNRASTWPASRTAVQGSRMVAAMSAPARTSFREQLRHSLADPTPETPLEGQRTAAIALILLDLDASLEVLLIERATRDGDPWSGHMALPGGHRDPTDGDLGATAERETLEEVGLDLRAHGERLGRLSDCMPIRGVPIAVRPYVYLLAARPTLLLSAEVRQALWVPVAPLLSGAGQTTYSLSRGNEHLELPAWNIDGRVVWGLTYRVLDEFFRRFNALLKQE
jgi:8-oxo-dGTP pyrophosphatase MutT (NUDIX family)